MPYSLIFQIKYRMKTIKIKYYSKSMHRTRRPLKSRPWRFSFKKRGPNEEGNKEDGDDEEGHDDDENGEEEIDED
jgi:hypothetical protein